MFELHEKITNTIDPPSEGLRNSGVHVQPGFELSIKRSFSKRALDLSVSLLLAPFGLAIVIPAAVLTLVTDPKGGVFFIQARTGRNGKTFRCIKLRTMKPHDEVMGPAQRITRLGMILRKTHVDEIPQLWNVLRGEMSLVGPRPHMLSDTELFTKMDERYPLRHCVKPGITGLAQVNGYFGHVESVDHLKRRIDFDLEYAEDPRVFRDIRILFQTLNMQWNSL